jgi:hypothetical protein
MKKKGGEDWFGNCAFCLAKCPKCGSTDVSISLTVTYHCENDERNVLVFELDTNDEEITLQCIDCNGYFTTNNLSSAMKTAISELTGTLPEDHERIRKLFYGVTEKLPEEIRFEAHEDGTITSEPRGPVFTLVDVTERVLKRPKK